MIDTHCHLYWDTLKGQEEEVIKRAKKAGVKKFLNIGCDLKTSLEAKKQAETFEEVFFTVGVHPAEHKEKIIDWTKLEELISNKKCLAIGECGFDFFHTPFDEKKQEEIFLKQIKLAKKYNKPLIIHTRGAGEKVLDYLEKNFNRKFVIHCFSESQSFANRVLKMGGLISIGGILTFPKSNKLREIITIFPIEKIMLETDSPFLAPQSNRGKINEPAFIKEIALKISEIKKISINKVIDISSKNAEKFFLI